MTATAKQPEAEKQEKEVTKAAQEQTALAAPKTAPIVNVDDSANSAFLDTGKFTQMYRAAGILSRCTMIPERFQKRVDDCFLAIEIAERLKCDVFALMQSMYVVPGSGKPSFLGTFVIAMINAHGPFTGPVQWRYERDARGVATACTAYATHRHTKELCECRIPWSVVVAEGWLGKSGSKWKTMPDQMFAYRTATWLARRYCPEVIMGMSTVDEAEDVIDVSTVEPKSIPSTNGERQPFGFQAAPEPAKVIDQETGEEGAAPAQQAPQTAEALAAQKAKLAEAEQAAPAHVSSSPDAAPPADWQPQEVSEEAPEPGSNG